MKPFFKGSFKAICVPLSSTVGHLTCPTLQLDTEPFERQGEASVTGMSEIQGPVGVIEYSHFKVKVKHGEEHNFSTYFGNNYVNFKREKIQVLNGTH